MFDGLYIASLTSHYLFSWQSTHVLVQVNKLMFLWWPYGDWLNMNIIYPYTIYVDKGRLSKRGKYGENTGKF